MGCVAAILTEFSNLVHRAGSLAAIAGPSFRRPRLGGRCSFPGDALTTQDRSVRLPPDQPEEDLPSLFQILLTFKQQSRRPNDTAYHAILRCASDYEIRRGGGSRRNGSEEEESGIDDVKSPPDGLGWHLAVAALLDAEKGGVDLGTEGIAQLMRVSLPLRIWLTLWSSFPSYTHISYLPF